MLLPEGLLSRYAEGTTQEDVWLLSLTPQVRIKPFEALARRWNIRCGLAEEIVHCSHVLNALQVKLCVWVPTPALVVFHFAG